MNSKGKSPGKFSIGCRQASYGYPKNNPSFPTNRGSVFLSRKTGRFLGRSSICDEKINTGALPVDIDSQNFTVASARKSLDKTARKINLQVRKPTY